MDAVLDLLGFLGDPVKYWKTYAELVETNRWAAVLVGIPAVIYLSYIGLGQLYSLVDKYRGVLRLGAPLATAISLVILALATLGSYAIVYVIAQSRAARPVLEHPGLLIGQRIVLSWSYAEKEQQHNVRYEVESAKDRLFAKDLQSEHKSVPGKLLLIPRDFNDTRYLRIRAVTLDESGGGAQNSVLTKPLSPWSHAFPITQYQNALERIKRTGRVEIYTSVSLNQGFFAFTKKEGNSTGFDFELARMIVKELGRKLGVARELEPAFAFVSWEELFRKPGSGQADFIIASITSRPEREQQFGLKFSRPYYQTTLSLIHRIGTTVDSVQKALPGKAVGVQDKTTSDAVVSLLEKAYGGTQKLGVVRFKQSVEALRELQNSPPSVDFVIADTPFAIGAVMMTETSTGNVLGQKEFTEADFPSSVPADMRSEPYAIAVRSAESKLLEYINEVLAEFEGAGKLKALEGRMRDEYRTFLRQR